jgi:hypothetical protein
MSVVPSIRAAMPTPVPGPLTAILTFGLAFMKFSAQTELTGVTVFEPMILIEPDKVEASAAGELLVHPDNMRATASIKGIKHSLSDFVILSSCCSMLLLPL